MSTFHDNHLKNQARTAGERAYPTVAIEPLDIQVGDTVRFYGERTSGLRNTTVRAVTEHYALCTWPARQGASNYAIISWKDGWRGPHGSWGHGAVTDEDCQNTLTALENGEIEMSHRHSVSLDISTVHRDGHLVFSDTQKQETR